MTHLHNSMKCVPKRLEITSALSVLRMRGPMSNVGLDPRLYVQLARYFLSRVYITSLIIYDIINNTIINIDNLFWLTYTYLFKWEQLSNDEDDMPHTKARAIYYWKATIDIITSTQKCVHLVYYHIIN